jgi:hypothetical protein
MSMAPWEELRYFKLPVETVHTTPVVGTRLVNADPMRVLLIFSTAAATNTWVSLSPTPATQQGVLLNAAAPFILTPRDTPGLVQAAWFCAFAGGPTITTIEVFMLDWPADPHKLAAERDGQRSYAEYLGRVQGQKARVERAADIVRRIREGRLYGP